MITKEEAKTKLRKAGYSVVDDNAVVTVLVSEQSNIKNVVKDIKEILVKAEYNASFGVKQTSASLEDSVEPDYEVESDFESVKETDSESVKEPDSESDTVIIEEVKTEFPKKKTSKPISKKAENDDFFDDEDEDIEGASSQLDLDAFDMDMLLNEDSVQFSLEDFGMM